jgi:hypothetical protein
MLTGQNYYLFYSVSSSSIKVGRCSAAGKMYSAGRICGEVSRFLLVFFNIHSYCQLVKTIFCSTPYQRAFKWDAVAPVRCTIQVGFATKSHDSWSSTFNIDSCQLVKTIFCSTPYQQYQVERCISAGKMYKTVQVEFETLSHNS